MPDRQLIALVVDDGDVMAGQCAPEGTWLQPRRRRGSRRRCSSRPGRMPSWIVMPHRSSNTATTSGSRIVAGRDETSEARRAEALELADARRGRDTRAATGTGCSVRGGRAGRAVRQASNSPCMGTTSAPRDHGPTTVFQTAGRESVGAVHQTASPRPTSSQCSAWTRVAKTEPCVCATSLRVPLRRGSRR